DPLVRCQRFAGFETEAVDDVEHAFGQQIGDELDEYEDRGRSLLGRFEDDAVAGGQSRSQLPHSHEDREVPRNDLTDHTEGFVEVVGDGVVVDLGQSAFLGADGTGEV